MRGTGLQDLMDEYTSLKQSITKIESAVKKSAAELPDLQALSERLRRKLQSSEKLSELRANVETLRKQCAWALVETKEQVSMITRLFAESLQDVQRLTEEIEGLEAKMEAIEQKRQAARRNFEPKEKEITDFERDLSGHDAKKPALEQTMRQAKKKLDEMVREQTASKVSGKPVFEQSLYCSIDLQDELKDLEKDMRQKEAEVADIEERIQRKEDALTSIEDPAVQADRARLRGVQTLLHNLQKDEPLAVRKVDDLREALDRANDDEMTAKQDVETASGNYRRAIDNHRSLEARVNNKLEPFGRKIDMVMEAIKGERWIHPPVGPLGKHVHLSDPKYRDVLQGLLGAFMCSFAVRTKQDSVTLRRVLERCAQR